MKKSILGLIFISLFAISCSHSGLKRSEHKKMFKTSKKSMETTMAFMGAMGKGDMKQMDALMADDMVWKNSGDKSLPWIGTWEGKKRVFEFLKIFSSNLKTTSWKTELSQSKGNNVTMVGTMSAKLTKSGKSTEPFSWALHVVVEDGKVKLWHWFEDTYAVSKAYHNK